MYHPSFEFVHSNISLEHSNVIPSQYVQVVDDITSTAANKTINMPTVFPVNIQRIPVKVLNLSDNELPKYSHEYGDSGMDVRAFIGEDVPRREIYIYPHEIVTVKTGLHVEIPFGYEIQLRPRSGLGKLYVNLANCIGTIDSNYRGEIMLMMHNFGVDRFIVEHGDRIGQLVLCPVLHMEWREVNSIDDLNSTERGHGGFGHTGVK